MAAAVHPICRRYTHPVRLSCDGHVTLGDRLVSLAAQVT